MGLPHHSSSYSDQSQKSVLRVWRDPSAAGGLNMAADEALARRSEETNSVLMRLYGWQPHTVSLGCFQKIDDFFVAWFQGFVAVYSNVVDVEGHRCYHSGTPPCCKV